MTEIVEDLLQNFKRSNEVYAKFRSSIPEELILQNLFDYYYLFYVERDLKYESKILFNVTPKRTKFSS